MTNTTRTAPLALTIGSLYAISGSHPQSTWAYELSNRGWHSFRQIGDADPKSHRTSRLADISLLALASYDRADVAGPSAADPTGEQPDDVVGPSAADPTGEQPDDTADPTGEQPDDRVNDELTGNVMAAHISRYSQHYVTGTNASGTKTKTNGDALALAWLALDVPTFCNMAAIVCGVSPLLYAKLNPGQQRMNFGNRLRAQIRKGNVTVDELLVAAAKLSRTATAASDVVEAAQS